MAMNIIEKLIEFGYKEGRDFVVFGNRDEIDTIVIGEIHRTPRLIYHHYKIIKEFKPKIIGHEGFDEDSINDSSVYESFKEFYEVSKEIFYKIIENQNYREILEKILEEKYKNYKEVKEIIPKIHELMKESVSKFLEIYPGIEYFHELDENTKNEIRNIVKEINSMLSKLNSYILLPIWTHKLELEFLKEVIDSDINKDELDKLVDKYAMELLSPPLFCRNYSFKAFKFINGTHLVVIDDNEEKKEQFELFNTLLNTLNKASVLEDLLIKKYQLDSNTKLSQILQKISKVVAIENTNNNNPTIENLKKILELVETFKMEIEKPEGLSNEVLKEVLKEIKKGENEIKEKIDVLSSHNYDSIVKGIIKNLKENEKRFLEECKNNGIEKKDLRYILLYDICINTNIYIDIKLSELHRMFMHTDDTIREKKMFETIKNLKDKSVIIMGDYHVINLEPKLKKLSEEEKRNILILHQRHILDKDDNILGSCVYGATHIYDIPELASLMNNIIKYHILSDEL